jgi:hypothetical protein
MLSIERDEEMRKHVYIVGAGFSHYAGLPLQAGFTKALLEPRDDEKYALRPLITHLGKFAHDVFGHTKSARAQFWPNLEDVFTNIDLAANSGHHLGQIYAPSKLRTTRRVLLARMMCMLHERLEKAEVEKGQDWDQLSAFFKRLALDDSAFISMNWDTVVERRLARLRHVHRIEYECGAIPALFPSTSDVISRRRLPAGSDEIPLVKMHGSVNWLYCDNCRKLYWFRPDRALNVAMQLITRNEAEELRLEDPSVCGKWHCVSCTSVPLTTRIATFSYLKALDFPMFEKSWLSAERLLRDAEKWIFIGYSLPAADYEFKHLLKRVQLSRTVPPPFVVITGGDGADGTYRNYQGFFGLSIKRDNKLPKSFFSGGLDEEALRAIHA